MGCPLCKGYAPVAAGRISKFHLTENGTPCDGAGMCITLDAAIARDSQLNPQEHHVYRRMWGWHLACKGYDRITGEPCHHPVCDERRGSQATSEQLSIA
jgi:hypothetical protein